jgi:TonB family protein
MTSGEDSGPNLLLDWSEINESRRFFRAGLGSVLAHAVIVLIAIGIGSLDTPVRRNAPQIVANFRVTPLIAPLTQLTQKAPNTAKVSKELSVGNLMHEPAPRPVPPKPALRAFKPPTPQRSVPPDPGTPSLPELPKPQDAFNPPPAVTPPIGVPNVPAPQIQAEEKPKLAFETPGAHGTNPVTSPTLSKLIPPKTSVEDAIHSVARGAGQGPIIVGDMDTPSLSDTMRLPQSPGRTGAQLELKSDPQGVDFRPYLMRIVALVRRNWLAVIPESAHMGAHGLVQLQFAIDRSGQVPKLVIAMPSGTQALDKAAVAGISASVPFPPLPAEYKGQQIRLELSFKYNQ